MPSSHSDSQPPEERPGPNCAGCPGCGVPSLEESPGPDGLPPTAVRAVLAPVGLFLLPVVFAIAGAILGGVTAVGELLGGLIGLALGMGTSMLGARAAALRRRP